MSKFNQTQVEREQVYKKVLKKINPNSKESSELNKLVKNVLTKLNKNLSKFYAQAIVGGSTAKNTWLSNNKEVDIFVQFDYVKYKYKSDYISELLQEVLKQTFKEKIERVHGSRDYFQVKLNKITFEFVPILNIKNASQAINITDVSPLHAEWVNKSTEKIKDEIKLAKRFCKANKLYGAESYLSAFSGYVLEILVVNYGSFDNLLQESIKWKDKTVIDIENYHKTKHMVMFNLNNSKLNSPLVVVDPVDKNRNAAAAFSKGKFNLFKKIAKKFLEFPDETYFETKELKYSKLLKLVEERKGYLCYFELEAIDNKRDVAGAKLLKVYDYVNKKLNDYKILSSDWDWKQGENAKFYFIVKKKKLPVYQLRKGPPLEFKEHVKQFKEINLENYDKEGFVYAKIKVDYPKLDDFITNILKNNYLKDKYSQLGKVKFN
ncbi:CCA tRNA nucleotidyltransferase [archaeon]|jgi:tRNA nucleotidyltransferase (CCA-adding enzyme)|nr:CCA tRNA nucleotidyltransferase [archaeon]MBT3451567.1 CCA tRNA nucleotidyltransferase [archaeon]MBT6869426.1 CCA tRNA nucleotidyltransferase [archaeon]MBT7192589.1 CCA tRNA nucleotidyltransferase [archaeon]MBT7380665.1 CCA tRNA nucleotidyltransferase [archaeon]